MLSPLYVKNTLTVAKRVKDLQEEMESSDASVDINMAAGLRRTAAGAAHLSF